MPCNRLQLAIVNISADAREDVIDRLDKLRFIMECRGLRYMDLENKIDLDELDKDEFEDGGEVNLEKVREAEEAFMVTTSKSTELPHIHVDIDKVANGQGYINSDRRDGIYELEKMFGRVDKEVDCPKLNLILPEDEEALKDVKGFWNTSTKRLLHVICACDGSIVMSFPFEEGNDSIKKSMLIVTGSATFAEKHSGRCNFFTGAHNSPSQILQAVRAYTEEGGVQTAQIITTSDFSVLRSWWIEEGRMDAIREYMVTVKDGKGNIQWIKKSNKEAWRSSGGVVLAESMINALIKKQVLKESDYAGFLEKQVRV